MPAPARMASALRGVEANRCCEALDERARALGEPLEARRAQQRFREVRRDESARRGSTTGARDEIERALRADRARVDQMKRAAGRASVSSDRVRRANDEVDGHEVERRVAPRGEGDGDLGRRRHDEQDRGDKGRRSGRFRRSSSRRRSSRGARRDGELAHRAARELFGAGAGLGDERGKSLPRFELLFEHETGAIAANLGRRMENEALERATGPRELEDFVGAPHVEVLRRLLVDAQIGDLCGVVDPIDFASERAKLRAR